MKRIHFYDTVVEEGVRAEQEETGPSFSQSVSQTSSWILTS